MTDVTNLLTSDKDDWETPPWLYRWLDSFMHFDVDVCSNGKNAKHSNFISLAHGGDCFKDNWRDYIKQQNGPEPCFFMNPPWGRRKVDGKIQSLENFVNLAFLQAGDGFVGAMVLPAHVESIWFRDLIASSIFSVIFLTGRVNYYVDGSEYYIPTKGKRKGIPTKTASTIGTILAVRERRNQFSGDRFRSVDVRPASEIKRAFS